MTLWSRGLVRSRGKLNPLFLHYRNAYGRQIWQDDTSLEGLLPIMLLNTSRCSRGLARSPDKLKTHFHYHNACGHKTWHDGGLSWTPSSHVIYPSTHDHIITWSYEITWQTKIIMYSRSPSITWSCNAKWKIRSVISLLLQGLWPPNLERSWLTNRSFQL